MSLIDPGLAAVLVCPLDQGSLSEDPVRSGLVCQTCGRTYPVSDGIPIMLIDQSEEARDD